MGKSSILKELRYSPEDGSDELSHLQGEITDELPELYRQPWNLQSPLAELLEPLGVKAFLSDYLGQNYYHFRANDARRLERYFSYDSLSELLTNALCGSNVGAFDADRRKLFTMEFARMVNGDLIVDPSQVAKLLRAGGSMTIKQTERIHPGLGDLANDLVAWMGFDQAFINLYYTPRGGQTFPWHQDSQDFFVFQVEGKKSWDIYKPHYRVPFFPFKIEEHVELGIQKENSEFLERVTLEKGDLLYLPSCFPHEVRCLPSDDSLHLAVCVLSQQRHLLLRQVVHDSINRLIHHADLRCPIFRTSHGGLDPREKKAIIQWFKNIFDNIGAKDFERVYLDYLADHTPPAPDVQMANMLALLKGRKISQDCLLSRTRTHCRVVQDFGQLHLITQRRALQFETRARRALDYMTKSTSFRLSDVPGLEGPDDREELAWALVDLGLLVPQ